MSTRKRARTTRMAAEMKSSAKGVKSQEEEQFDHHQHHHHHHHVALFLMACGLCGSPLHPEKDIYIYKGEIAFCTPECREVLIRLGEWKEKCLLSAVKTTTGPEAKNIFIIRPSF